MKSIVDQVVEVLNEKGDRVWDKPMPEKEKEGKIEISWNSELKEVLGDENLVTGISLDSGKEIKLEGIDHLELADFEYAEPPNIDSLNIQFYEEQLANEVGDSGDNYYQAFDSSEYAIFSYDEDYVYQPFNDTTY